MRTEATPCPFCGSVQLTPAEVEAHVNKVLDAADRAHVDLWELERCRRKLVHDEAEYGELTKASGGMATGRLIELEHSIELRVSALAAGFQQMALLVTDRAEHGRP